jgi:hypothetical protein
VECRYGISSISNLGFINGGAGDFRLGAGVVGVSRGVLSVIVRIYGKVRCMVLAAN